MYRSGMADQNTDSPSDAVTDAIDNLVAEEGNQPPADDDKLQNTTPEPMAAPEPLKVENQTEQAEPDQKDDDKGDPEPEAEEGEDGETVEPVKDAVDELAREEGDEPTDDPDEAAKDQEWLDRLQSKSRKRFEKLLAQRDEARTKAEELEARVAEVDALADAGRVVSDLKEAGLEAEEIANGHAIMYALKNEPETGIKAVYDYMKAYADQAKLNLAEIIPELAPKAPEGGEGVADDDLDLLVEEGLLQEADVAAIRASRNPQAEQAAPATAEPEKAPEAEKPETPPSAAQDGPSEETTLVADFLASEGVAIEEMERLFRATIEPKVLELVAEDGIKPENMTPKQVLRYVKDAWAATKPVVKKPAKKAEKPPQDEKPEANSRPSPKSPTERAVDMLAYGS